MGLGAGAALAAWATHTAATPASASGIAPTPSGHVKPLGVPAWRGALIGHIDRQFTLPLGAEVEIDAAAGTIRMLAPAVR
jgi:hypothetical protein